MSKLEFAFTIDLVGKKRKKKKAFNSTKEQLPREKDLRWTSVVLELDIV